MTVPCSLVAARTLPGGTMLLLVAGLGLACRVNHAEWRAVLAAARAERLSGPWRVAVRLDRTAGNTLPRREASGQITLALNEQRYGGPGFDSPPMYFGTYDRSFDSLGPTAVRQGGVTTVVGMLRGGDLLDLKLAPELPRLVELVGLLPGYFVLRRR